MKPSEPLERQTIAIFDLDKTITKKDTYISFLMLLLQMHPIRLLRCGFLPIAIIIYKVGLKDNSWLKVTFLKTIAGGIKKTQLEICTHFFVKKLLIQGIHKKALQKIQEHRQAKHKLVLATASFDFYVEQLGKQLGFDTIICTQSLWDKNNKLTGEIDGNNCYGINKLNRLISSFEKNRSTHLFIGYSDHHSDQPFLAWVDHAVAVNPTKKLQEIALKNNFSIEDWNSN